MCVGFCLEARTAWYLHCVLTFKHGFYFVLFLFWKSLYPPESHVLEEFFFALFWWGRGRCSDFSRPAAGPFHWASLIVGFRPGSCRCAITGPWQEQQWHRAGGGAPSACGGQVPGKPPSRLQAQPQGVRSPTCSQPHGCVVRMSPHIPGLN